MFAIFMGIVRVALKIWGQFCGRSYESLQSRQKLVTFVVPLHGPSDTLWRRARYIGMVRPWESPSLYSLMKAKIPITRIIRTINPKITGKVKKSPIAEPMTVSKSVDKSWLDRTGMPILAINLKDMKRSWVVTVNIWLKNLVYMFHRRGDRRIPTGGKAKNRKWEPQSLTRLRHCEIYAIVIY